MQNFKVSFKYVADNIVAATFKVSELTKEAAIKHARENLLSEVEKRIGTKIWVYATAKKVTA